MSTMICCLQYCRPLLLVPYCMCLKIKIHANHCAVGLSITREIKPCCTTTPTHTHTHTNRVCHKQHGVFQRPKEPHEANINKPFVFLLSSCSYPVQPFQLLSCSCTSRALLMATNLSKFLANIIHCTCFFQHVVNQNRTHARTNMVKISLHKLLLVFCVVVWCWWCWW